MPQSVDGDIRLSVSFNLEAKDVKREAQNLKEILAKTLNSGAGKGNPQLEKMMTQMQKSYFTIEKLQDKMKALESDKVPTAQYKDLETELDSLRKKTDELAEAREKWSHVTGTGKYFAAGEIEKIDAEFNKVISKIEELEQKKQDLESSGGAFTIANPEALNQVVQQLNFATRTAEGLANKFNDVKRDAHEAGQPIKEFGPSTEGAKKAVHAFGTALKTAFKGLQGGVRTAAKAFSAVANAAKRAFSKIKSLASSAVNSVKTSFSKLKDGAKNAFTHIDKSATKGLKNLLRYGLGIRGLFMLFRKLRGYATDAFKGIAQQSSSFNKTMSNITNTFNQFKGSIGTALQPLITIVEPILIRIMNLFINAANAVGSFFATLTGQKYIYKAVKANNSYADSISGTGKAAKEANKQLAEYDKLMVIQQDNASDAGGGGASGGGGFTEELVDPDNSVSKFAQDLKDAWENQDFAAIGEIVGEKINELTNKIKEAISWDNVGPEIEQFMENWGTAFNSLVDTVDWENIGSTVAEGLNTITNTVQSFLDNFNIDELGTAFAEVINGFDKDVNWENLGSTVASGLNEVSKAINNFQNTGNWKQLGSDFATAINKLVDDVNGEELGKALSAKLRIMLEAANGFVHTFEWEDAGSTLSDIVEGWFGNIDWKMWGDTVATGINGISDTVTSFVEDTNWEQIGKDIGDGFTTMTKQFNGKKVGKALSAPIQALNDAVSGLLDSFGEGGTWEEAGKDIGDVVNSWFSGIKWDQVAKNITKGSDGIVKSIKTALSTIKWQEVGADLGELINGVLNIDWKEAGKALWAGVEGILDLANSALQTVNWAQLGQDIVDFLAGIDWGELFKKAWTLIRNLGLALGNVLRGAWNACIDLLLESDIPGWMKSLISNMKFDESELNKHFSEETGKVEKSLQSELDRGGGGKFKLTLEAEVKGDLKDIEKSWNNIDSKNPKLSAEAKETGSIAIDKLEKDWAAIESKNPKMNAETKEVVNGALKALRENWDKVDSKDPVLRAEARETVANALSTIKSNWSAIDSKDAKLTATGETTPEFTKTKEKYDSFKDDTAKKKITGETDKSFTDTKTAFDGIGNDKAKKTVTGETAQSFTDAKSEYDKLKNKEVDITAKTGKTKDGKTMKEWFGGLWAKFKAWFNSGKKKGDGLEVNAKNTTDKKTVSSWWDSIKAKWGNKTLDMKGKVTDVSMTDKAKKSLQGQFSVHISNPGTFGGRMAMAKGGIVTHATRALIGEAGPEAVIPLKNNTEWLDIVSKYVVAHLNIGKIDVPHLAKGQVIPPNRQFLAMLGDQKSGTNVEAPLKTIEQALENVLKRSGGSSAPIILQLDGKQIAKVVWSESDKRYKQTGRAY